MTFSENQIHIISAILAVSNMGQEKPKIQDVARLKNLKNVSLDCAVVSFAEQYMESDEHYDMFMLEAEYFKKELVRDPSKCPGYWSDAFKLYEEA
jgi:hypothetical protein